MREALTGQYTPTCSPTQLMILSKYWTFAGFSFMLFASSSSAVNKPVANPVASVTYARTDDTLIQHNDDTVHNTDDTILQHNDDTRPHGAASR